MSNRTLALDPGSPEWAAHQNLDSCALALSRSLTVHHPGNTTTDMVHTGLGFILNRLENTSLYTRGDLEALIQRSIGAASVLSYVLTQSGAKPDRYETLLPRLINDFHKIYLSLAEECIERHLVQLRHAHQSLKGEL